MLSKPRVKIVRGTKVGVIFVFTFERTSQDIKELWHIPSVVPFYGSELVKAASKQSRNICRSALASGRHNHIPSSRSSQL